MQLESSRPVGVRTLAHFARRNLADKLRKQGEGQAVTALLGGWDEVRAFLIKDLSLRGTDKLVFANRAESPWYVQRQRVGVSLLFFAAERFVLNT